MLPPRINHSHCNSVFRGFGEFSASAWLNDPASLKQQLSQVSCAGGATQIARLIRHYLYEADQSKALKALVFVGDAVEESIDELRGLAVQCRLKDLPLLLFQEGRDASASEAFKLMATLSGGAHLQFDDTSSDKLKIFASGRQIHNGWAQSASKIVLATVLSYS